MKFNFKEFFNFKKKNKTQLNINKDNKEEKLELDDLKEDLEDDLEFLDEDKKNFFKNFDFDLKKLKNNKKVLYILPLVIIGITLSAASYYYYLMKSSNIELAELKKPLPKIKKIEPRKKIKNRLKKEKVDKVNNKLNNKIIKNKKNNNDIFSSVMNRKRKINNIKKTIITNKNKEIENIINNSSSKVLSKIKKEKFIKKPARKLNIKNKLKIVNNKLDKNITDKTIVKELAKDETLIKKDYLPILTNDKPNNKKDVYALTAEELLKLKNMDTYINQKQKYMEKVTKFLIKKQKYLEALKNFNEFQNLMKNQQKIDYEKQLKKELDKKIEDIKKSIEVQLQTLNNNIKLMKEKEIVSNAKDKIKSDMMSEKNLKDNETLNKKNIEQFFKDGQIFVMNNEYIISVNHNNSETIYKKGEQVLDGFTITNITSNMITLEKNNKLYFYNLKAHLGSNSFSKVIVELPLMVDNSKAEDRYNKKVLKDSENTKVPKYLSPSERKKLEAKKFFNITNK